MRHRQQTIRDYHEATKHRFRRHAPGPGYLDWDNRPALFRHHAGAELLSLSVPRPWPADREPDLATACAAAAVPVHDLDAAGISELLYHSLAISSWRRAGETLWSVRCTPSSGNLHPTEAYLLGGPLPGLLDAPAVLHYDARVHGLEVRATPGAELFAGLRESLGGEGVLAGLSTVPWRQAWKYGERGLRYCHLDAGHALAALALAAARLGWGARLLEEASSAELAALLGLIDTGPAEPELPVALLALGPTVAPAPAAAPVWQPLDIAGWEGLDWRGRPSRLSREVRPWPLLAGAAAALDKPATPGIYGDEAARAPSPDDPPLGEALPAGPLLRGRRSATGFDPAGKLSENAFYDLMATTLPASASVPWSLLAWEPRVDLLVFVHRVDGLRPGLYGLVRSPGGEEKLRADLRRDYIWQRPAGCPAHLPFYRLSPGDQQPVARILSCVQDLASDGAFTVAMLADFDGSLARHGSWFYARLHWECGVIGQMLYLGAEALGLGGCGLGCFFDDAVHETVGLNTGTRADRQTLYHFAVGAPVVNRRIQALPAYPPPEGTEI
ncbi:MAG: nitroreductase family protein [Candidatus Krumholzibacteriia bacterium]